MYNVRCRHLKHGHRIQAVGYILYKASIGQLQRYTQSLLQRYRESVAAMYRVCCSDIESLLQRYRESVAAMYRVCCIDYGVATVSRIDSIIGLFCRIASLLFGSFANETYNLVDPTNRSHPI